MRPAHAPSRHLFQGIAGQNGSSPENGRPRGWACRPGNSGVLGAAEDELSDASGGGDTSKFWTTLTSSVAAGQVLGLLRGQPTLGDLGGLSKSSMRISLT